MLTTEPWATSRVIAPVLIGVVAVSVAGSNGGGGGGAAEQEAAAQAAVAHLHELALQPDDGVGDEVARLDRQRAVAALHRQLGGALHHLERLAERAVGGVEPRQRVLDVARPRLGGRPVAAQAQRDRDADGVVGRSDHAAAGRDLLL